MLFNTMLFKEKRKGKSVTITCRRCGVRDHHFAQVRSGVASTNDRSREYKAAARSDMLILEFERVHLVA